MQVFDIPIDSNKKESTLHGSYEFPMAIYETRLDKNVLGFVNWHWHNEVQFCLVTKGQVAFYVNSNFYNLEQGQGIYINSGCLHMAKPVCEPDSAYICLDADAKLFSSFQGSAIEQKYVKPFLVSANLIAIPLSKEEHWQGMVLDKLKKIHSLYTAQDYGYEIDICMELSWIWKQMITNTSVALANTETSMYTDYQRMKTILSYIHEHYAQKMTLDEIAQTVHLSRSECCRFFKRSANCTLFEYIMDYRINKSIEFLQYSDMTVSQIADAVGFGSTSYFVESFRKQTACTPKEYRKSYMMAKLSE